MLVIYHTGSYSHQSDHIQLLHVCHYSRTILRFHLLKLSSYLIIWLTLYEIFQLQGRVGSHNRIPFDRTGLIQEYYLITVVPVTNHTDKLSQLFPNNTLEWGYPAEDWIYGTFITAHLYYQVSYCSSFNIIGNADNIKASIKYFIFPKIGIKLK